MIKNYLSYLKDISRKIVSDSGFEKVLIDKSSRNPSFTFQNSKKTFKYSQNNFSYDKILRIDEYLNRNRDKKLFCGIGLIAGHDVKQYAAPILYLECEIIYDNTKKTYSLNLNFETTSFNYDLITSILNNNSSRYSIDEESFFNDNFIEELKVVEEIENNIEQYQCIEELNNYSTSVFDLLKKKISEFKKITISNSDYNFDREYTILKDKPKRNRFDARSRPSIFEGELVFVEGIHFFVNSVPHQLSTYESLKQLIAEVEKNKFQNRVLEKVLKNIISGSKEELRNKENEEVEHIVESYIPLTLSKNQIKAIKNAFSSEVSYIQGPPGTGKSYTIGAIVLVALFLNKKILLVSQKEPALDVIKKKIEKYLTDDQREDFEGITYYKFTNKNELRNNLNYLREKGNHQRGLNFMLNKLDDLIKDDKNWITGKLNEINKLEEKLSENLELENKFNEINNEYLRIRDNFIEQTNNFKEFGFDNNYLYHDSFENSSAYNRFLENFQKCIENRPTLAFELYKLKCKTFFEGKFSIDLKYIPDNQIRHIIEELIELNTLYFKSISFLNRITSDNDQIRNKIKTSKLALLDRQKKFLRRKFRFQTLIKLSEKFDSKAKLRQDNLDSLDKLLYWKKPNIIANQMKEIDFELVTEILPFWLSETRYLGQILPMKPNIFDLVIVDESSQVNLAEVLPAFYRGKNIVIVGDHKQLGLDSTGVNFRLSNRFDNLMWGKNFRDLNISFSTATDYKLTVTKCSILDFIRSENSKVSIREEMLNEHFRSMPALAKYTNTNYYDGLLRIMTETSERINENCFQVIEVPGFRDKSSKVIQTEADTVLSIIKYIIYGEKIILNDQNIEINIPHSNYKNISIGVVSLMTNQRELIDDLISENLPYEKIEEFEIETWTPQSAQGNERDIIIISLGLDTNCNGLGNYYKNKRLLNVATSRARLFTVVVHSGFKKDKYSELAQYLNLTKEMPSWSMNHNLYESEFEKKVFEKLLEYSNERKNISQIDIFNQVQACGHKRLDFVLVNQTNKKAVAIEVDGRFHYQSEGSSSKYSEEHLERVSTLKLAGWEIIHTPYYKWYQNGWLSKNENPVYFKEIERLYRELDLYLFSKEES
jgi:superfamily I DNA and/or RNA helicase